MSSITISTISGDDILNALEAGSDLPISGTTSNVSDGQIVTVELNSNTYNATVESNAWTANIPATDLTPTALPDGTYRVAASVTDADNGPAQASRNLRVDETAPTVTVALANDTGVSTSDGITKNATLTGTGDANAVVTLKEGINTLGTTTADITGAWSFTPTLSDGPHIITASETDTAGNTGSTSVNLALDTVAPAAPGTPDLQAASDSGASSADNITNVSLPAFSGTGENGATVTLLDGSTTIGTGTVTGGTWSITAATALHEGANAITAVQTDVAGNTSVASAPLNVTLDTTAPVVTAALTSDTGVSASDGFTKNAALTGTGAANAVVTLTDGINTLGTTTADGTGAWSFTPTLSDGPHTITASETDTAGNTGSASINLTLDTAAPAVTAALTSDTGVSTSDGITKNAALTGSGDANAVVTLKEGINTLGTATADSTGAWSFTPTLLPDGAQTITASETDTAGNTGSTSVNLTLDTVAPAAPGTPDLQAASDSGASSADNITNVSLPAFNGTGENGATVTLRDGSTPIGTATVTAGTWSITATTALHEGANAITAVQSDVAGNTSVASAPLNVTLDTTPPAAPSTPDLLTLSDSGASSTDNITKVSLPVFSGIGENGATVTLLDGSTTIGTGTVTGGNWSITATTALNEGVNAITAVQTDAAGNTSVASSPLSVTLDTTAPVVMAALTSDTGVSPNDGITNDAALTGSGDANAVVTLKEGINTLGTTTADGTGAWSFTPTPLPDGQHTIIASETDAAGNTGSASINFTLDNAAPVVTAALTSDTGVSPNDGITNDAALTGSGAANAVVTLTEGINTLGTATADITGAWSFTPTLSDGPHIITASETDTAGNTGSTSVNLTLDTVAPAAPGAPELQAASDSGASSTDNITNVSLPAFSGTGENGATVTLRDGSTMIGTGTVTAGTWSITATTALHEGGNAITAEQTDLSGNASVASSALSVTLDTAAPAAPSTPDLLALSDSGASSTDNITKVSLPVFSGIGENGATVTLLDGSTTIGTGTVAGGTWSITATTALNEGANAITAVQTDLAGNTSVASTPLNVTLDTTAPAVMAALTSDTGVSASDGITKNATLTGSGDANAVVTFKEGINTLGTTTANGTGAWSFTPTLSDGQYTITASETDTAGNTGSASINLTLDTVAPAAPGAPDLQAASDSGASSTDNITNVSLPAFSGTGENGATVTLRDGSTIIGTGTVTGGNWSITATTALHEGANAITAVRTDVAGNTSVASAPLNVTLDTTAPVVTAALTSDTGVSASDGFTKNAALTGTGDANAVVTFKEGINTLGTATADITGAWSFTPTLSDGPHIITASETDTAGNTGSTSVNLTLDTVAPAAPGAPDLLPSSDTGASSADNITNASLPIFSGTGENGATVTLRDGSTTIGTGTVTAGTWSITATTALHEGANAITAVQTDVAGNTSVASTPLNVTLDTTAPAAPGAPDLLPSSDSGASSTDNITKVSLPVFSGIGENGATVTLLDGSTTIGTGTVAGGNWSITATTALNEGVNAITAVQTDAAGNTSIASSPLSVTLDTTAPVVMAALTSDTGVSASDAITNDAALTGSGDANTVVTLKEGINTLGTTTADGTGAWSFTPTLLPDGAHTITASETDAAGNTGSASINFTLDNAAPVVTAALTSDTGVSPNDGITNDAALTGSGAANAVVTLTEGTHTLGTTTADSTGAWSFTPTLSDGPHIITASETDTAGNTGSASINFTLDTTPPAAPSAPDLQPSSDSGVSRLDKITKVRFPVFSGNGANGNTVTLRDGSTTIGTGTVANGTWSFTATTALHEGTNVITAVQTDAAGNTSTASAPLHVTLDTTAPAVTAALVSDTGDASDDAITKNAALTGTGDAYAVVTLKQGTNTLGTATADSTGAWSFTPTLQDGAHTITASETDAAGNTGSASIDLTLDTTAPVVTAALASDTGDSADDAITKNATLTGTGDADAVVTLKEGDNTLGTTTADSTGTWSFTPTLSDGPHTITASETDTAGNTGSTSIGFTLDTIVPTVTAVTASPSDGTLGAGQTASFTIGLSEAVTVDTTAGQPTLTLSDGATATYVSGSDTNALTFSYTITAGQAAPDLAVTGVNLNGSTITDAAGNEADLAGAAVNPPGTLTIAAVAPVEEFDAAYYLAHNPDVAAAGIDPAQHYAEFGWKEGRNPDAFFNTDYYLNQNPDVAAAGVDPLTHYETEGWKEGRDPSADFSTSAYLQANPDVAAAGIDPLLHYLQNGELEGRMAFIAQPHGVGEQNPLVDNTYYFAQNPDVRAAGLNPFTHYDSAGWQEGRNPDALFNTAYYLQQNPDVAAAHIDPMLHYEQFGWQEGRDPSADFSTTAYLNANPDVKAAGVNPLVQYEQFGIQEGRTIFHV